jgi:hypothetical protein
MDDIFITYRDGTFGRFTIPDTVTLFDLAAAVRDGEIHAYQFNDEHIGNVKVVIRGEDIRSIVSTKTGTVTLEPGLLTDHASPDRPGLFRRLYRKA